MKNKIKHNAFLIGLATVIVALDQWTKILVTHKMAVGEGFSPIAFLGDFSQLFIGEIRVQLLDCFKMRILSSWLSA